MLLDGHDSNGSAFHYFGDLVCLRDAKSAYIQRTRFNEGFVWEGSRMQLSLCFAVGCDWCGAGPKDLGSRLLGMVLDFGSHCERGWFGCVCSGSQGSSSELPGVSGS